jgi:hypothetical protein
MENFKTSKKETIDPALKVILSEELNLIDNLQKPVSKVGSCKIKSESLGKKFFNETGKRLDLYGNALHYHLRCLSESGEEIIIDPTLHQFFDISEAEIETDNFKIFKGSHDKLKKYLSKLKDKYGYTKNQRIRPSENLDIDVFYEQRWGNMFLAKSGENIKTTNNDRKITS